MELLEGENLGAYIAREGCAGRDTPRVWLQSISSALTAAHAVGVIHRDVNPSNIFVCADETIKLLDFGISRVLVAGEATKTAS